MENTEKAFTYWIEFLDMSDSYYRRTFLKVSGVAIASTAGCIDFSNTIPLRLYNTNEEEIVVSITVTRLSGDDEEVLSDTVTIPASGKHSYQDLLHRGGRYDFHVSVENGPEDWFFSGIDEHDLVFIIRISEEEITTNRIVE